MSHKEVLEVCKAEEILFAVAFLGGGREPQDIVGQRQFRELRRIRWKLEGFCARELGRLREG
jgi:hypothetical protein